MKRLSGIGLYMAVVTAVLFLGGPGDAYSAPKLNYQDLETAPENAYVTLWGEEFGSKAGRVLVGGVAANIQEWTEDRIVIQRPMSSGTDLVIFDNAGQTSKVYHLGYHKGSVYYISDRMGNDSFDGLSDTPPAGGPAARKPAARKTAAETGGAKEKPLPGPFKTIAAFLKHSNPGDVAYLRKGIYKEMGNPGYGAHVFIGPEYSGTSEQPVALIGYPGEMPIVGSLEHKYGILLFDTLSNWTLSRIAFRGSSAALLMSTMGTKENIRIIGNTAKGQKHANGVFQLTSTNNLKVLGNYIHHSGMPGNKFSHLIYYAGFGPGSDVSISWNRLHDQPGGRCIQVYGHRKEDVLDGLVIENNAIGKCKLDGILVGGNDEKSNQGWVHDATVRNNVITRTGSAGVRVNSPGIHATISENRFIASHVGVNISAAAVSTIRNNTFIKFGGNPAVEVHKVESLDMKENVFN